MQLSSGVRLVATFEAAKGALVLLAGFGFLSRYHIKQSQCIGKAPRNLVFSRAHYPTTAYGMLTS
jgi:hypothetical protein